MKRKKTSAARPSGRGRKELSPYIKYGMLALIILLAALIRVRFLDCPLERDEGEYAYAGQLILQGIPPYQLAYNMKLPGTYGAYALIMALFGQTPSAIHLGLLLVNSGTALLVYFLAARLWGSTAGLVASASYSFLSMSPSVLGTAGHATHFVLLPALAGILLLLKAIQGQKAWNFFWSGILVGLAFVMKQPGAFFILFAFSYYAWSEWHTRPRPWKRFARRGSLLGAGAIVPFGLTCLLLWWLGVFGRFWFWTFSYAREYATQLPLSAGLENLLIRISRVTGASIAVWIIAGLSLAALAWCRDARAQKPLVLGLLFFSFLAACPGFYFREHYFILVLPAVALLTGWAVSFAGPYIFRAGLPKMSAILVAVAALCFSLVQQRSFLFEMDPLMVCRTLYGANPFPECREIAKYIREHTAETDRIAVIGSEPELYFYSGRHSATGYIYTYGMMEEQKYASLMQKEMIAEVEAARPAYMVLVAVDVSWLVRPDSDRTIFTWADQFAEKHYALDGIVDVLGAEQTAYRWGNEAGSYQPRSPYVLKVFRRTDPPAGRK
jgi:hypothetical protein